MEIVFLITLIVLNGVFAMSEIALVTARRARLARLAEDGDGSAAVAMKLGEDPTRFLSTIQIGITSIGILNGIVGEAALAGPLAHWLQAMGLEQRVSEIGSTILVVVVITYVSKWFPKEKQGTALGIVGAGNIGAAVTKLLAPLVMVAYGWQGVAKIWSVGLAVVAVLFFLLTRDEPDLVQRKAEGVKPVPLVEPRAGSAA